MPTSRAFTLIELMIVILIITLLASLVLTGGSWLISQSRWLVTGQRLDAAVEAIQRKRGESDGVMDDFMRNGIGLDVRFIPITRLLSELMDTSKYGPLPASNSPLVDSSDAGESVSVPPYVRREKNAFITSAEFSFTSYGIMVQARNLWNGVGRDQPVENLIATCDIAPTREVLARGIRPSAYWYYSAWPVIWPMPAWDQADPPTVTPHVGSGCAFTHTLSEGDGPTHYRPIPPGLTITGSPFGKKRIRAYPKFRCGEHTMPLTLSQPDLSQLGIVRDIGAMEDPEPGDLTMFSPLVTTRLLRFADILTTSTGLNDYRTNRKSDRPWNDRWGNPLVLSATVFIPPRQLAFHIFDPPNRVADPFLGSDMDGPLYAVQSRAEWFTQNLMRRRDLLLQAYREAYTYNRSVTISGGAVGPERTWTKPVAMDPVPIANYQGNGSLTWSVAGDVGVASDAGTTSSIAPDIPVPLTDRKILRALWLQVLETTQAARWSALNAESSPPWRGGSFRAVARLNGRQSECLVMTPVEIK
ncbi:hypothetical protein LBMAG53_33800 [Planctomycetota bacterium]|nr:hypothetical protein LBMAG53_33800 [Planctomycetota bacterium]